MRKRKFLIIAIVTMLVVLLAVGLTGCEDKKEETVEATLTSVAIVGNENSVYYIEDFKLSDLKIKQTYSDGTEKVIGLDESMVSNKDKASLQFLDGEESQEKTISITHAGKEVTYTFTLTHNPSDKLKTFDNLVAPDINTTYRENLPAQNIKVEGFTAEQQKLIEDKSLQVFYKGNGQSTAGTYEVIAQISAPEYRTREIVAHINIAPQEVSMPIVTSRLVFNESTQQAPISVKEGDKSDEYQEFKKQTRITGDTRKRFANEGAKPYEVTVSLKDKKNYVWADSTKENNTEDIKLQWYIDKQVLTIADINWIRDNDERNSLSCRFDGALHNLSLKINNAKLARVLAIKYIVEEGFDSREQIDAGSYTAKAVISINAKDNNNYKFAEGSKLEYVQQWKIYHDRIPDRIEIDKDVFEYNGELQHPKVIQSSIDSILPGAKVVYSEGRRNVGKHQVTITISKEGYEPLVKVVSYEITKKQIEQPVIVIKSLPYNASEQKVQFKAEGNVFNVDDIANNRFNYLKYVKIKGNLQGIEPNVHNLTIELIDSNNVEWKDSVNKTEIINTSWQITKINLAEKLQNVYWVNSKNEKIPNELSDPNKKNYSETYNGKEHIVALNLGKKDGFLVTYSDEYCAVNAKKGLKARATIDLLYKDNETVGENQHPIMQADIYDELEAFNNLTLEQKTFNLTWDIDKFQIDCSNAKWANVIEFSDGKTVQVDNFIYLEYLNHIGATYKLELLNMPQGLHYTITGNTFVVPATVKEANAKIGDFINATDNTIIQELVISADPSITQNLHLINLNMPKLTVVYKPIPGISKDSYTDETHYYNDVKPYEPIRLKGNVGGATIKYYPDKSVKNVGKYVQSVEVTKTGYSCFFDEATLTIEPVKIAKPTLPNTMKEGEVPATEYVFNGLFQDCGLRNSDMYEITGDYSGYLPKEYMVYVNIPAVRDESGNIVTDEYGKPLHNYIWQGANKGEETKQVELTWKIIPADFDKIDASCETKYVYDRKSHSIKIQNIPAGFAVRYLTYNYADLYEINGQPKALEAMPDALIDNPENHGKYITVVKLDFLGTADINECYTVKAVNAVNAFNKSNKFGNAEVIGTIIEWEILQKEIDLSNVAWKTFDITDKLNPKFAPTVYQKNYLGEETIYKCVLINLPQEFENIISYENEINSAIGTYTVIATLYDKFDNYVIKAENSIPYEKKDGVVTFKYNWDIYENNVDGLISYQEKQIFRYEFNGIDKGGQDVKEMKPLPTIKQPTLNGQDIGKLMEDNVIKEEFLAIDGYQTTAVKEVGVYNYIVRLTVPGFAISEKIVTVIVKPMRILKPVLKDNKSGFTMPYSANTVCSIYDKFELEMVDTESKEEPQPMIPICPIEGGKGYKWFDFYRIDNITMSEKGVYTPTAVLLSKNYIWAGETEEADNADDLTFKDETGYATYTWAIV